MHEQPLVHDLVAGQAQRFPDALAVAARDARLTYRELQTRANQLAHLLRASEVGAEVTVGLCLPRSAALTVAALGIVESGGAYVALDPESPLQRLEFMLDDASALAVVTTPALAPSLDSGKRTVIALDPAWTALDERPATRVRSDTSAGNLAYVIYTSGSTGQPKGVMLEHRGLANLVRWHNRAFSLSDNDRCTLVASPGFDASVWEMWPVLCAGGSLHVPGDDVRARPETLRDWLLAEGITVSFLPTPLAEAMMCVDWPAAAALRHVLTGGDALHRHPSPELPFTLVNNYGPAEATVVATSGAVPTSTKAAGAPALGAAIDGVHVSVVDERLRPVEPGAVGELLIGGAGVGRGYIRREELTAERFLPDPSSPDPGARLYRSGDLVRAAADGTLEFVGRADDQVKIRGRRIEMGEIAATLDTHPGVQAAYVTTQERGATGPELVAYVVPRPNHPQSRRRLQEHLGERLPAYMVPAAYVWLDELPMTMNGKVDRPALPRPVSEPEGTAAGGSEPRTDLENTLSAMVAEVLGQDSVGLDENFFMLGGHSLLGAQLITRIEDRFGIAMSLRALFDNPTVAGIAAEVERLLVAELEAMSDEEADLLAGSRDGHLQRSA